MQMIAYTPQPRRIITKLAKLQGRNEGEEYYNSISKTIISKWYVMLSIIDIKWERNVYISNTREATSVKYSPNVNNLIKAEGFNLNN